MEREVGQSPGDSARNVEEEEHPHIVPSILRAGAFNTQAPCDPRPEDHQPEHIEEADNFVDFVMKKFNLEPIFEAFFQLLSLLAQGLTSYAAFVAFKDLLDLILNKLELFRRYAII